MHTYTNKLYKNKTMAKKKVMYRKNEVVFYYTSGVVKEKKEAWINIVVRGGKRIALKGMSAIKLLKKIIA